MGFLKDFLFGSDSSEEAFRLNQENIAAGVAALQSAGEEGLPLLEAIAPFLGAEFARAEATLTPHFDQARQALFSGRVASAAMAERGMKEALATTTMGAYGKGLQGTSIEGQARGQAMQQAQLTAQQGEAQYGQQIAGLYAQEGTQKAGLIAQGAQAQAGAKAAVPAYMAQLAQAEANMRGGISYQGAATEGFLGKAASAFAQFKGMEAIAAAGGCWVAREVYGPTNPTWMVFREWLFTKAPSWFRRLYLRHGEWFAGFISNKPRLKTLIRRWMDSRIS